MEIPVVHHKGLPDDLLPMNMRFGKLSLRACAVYWRGVLVHDFCGPLTWQVADA